MNPEKFSLFLLKNDRLELAVEEAWGREDHYATQFTAQSTLYQEVIGRQRLLCCVNRDEELILGSEGMLAAPLLNSEQGKIIGMLKIEKLAFLDLNLSSVQTFKVLCEWIATAYLNALRYENALSEKIFDENTLLFSYGFFDRQMAFLSSVAQRVGFDVSMIVLRLDNPEDLTDEQRGRLSSVLGKVVQSSLRRTDLAFDHRQAATEHLIVLPNASLENSQIVSEKLRNQLRESLPLELRHAQFSTSVQAIYRHDRSWSRLNIDLCADSRLLPSSLFRWHLKYLSLLASRSGFEIHMISARAKTGNWRDVARVIGTVVAVHLRQIDLAFEPLDDGIFRILLPNTTAEEARIVAALLVSKMDEEMGRNHGGSPVDIDVREVDVERPEEVLCV